MPPDTRNPAAWATRQGSEKSQQAALISDPSTMKRASPEDFAALFVSRKFNCSLPLARVIATLAELGGRVG